MFRVARRGLLTGPALPVVLAVVLVGCANGRHLDMADLTHRLEDQMRERVPGASRISAECPTAKAVRISQGVSFRCTVSVDGRRLLVTLTQTDEQGHVSSAVDG